MYLLHCCISGYTLSTNNHSCIDIDECSMDASTCNAAGLDFPVVVNGFCQNEIGSYNCYCETGIYFSYGQWISK